MNPRQMLTMVRSDLSTTVLPTMDDDRAKSSVIAAMGILANLALQIREDDAWVADSLAVLQPAATRWRDAPGTADASAGPDLDSPQLRDALLAEAEERIAALWRDGADQSQLHEIRTALYRDLQLQLNRSR